MTYPQVLFDAGFAARSLQTAAGMLVARALACAKIPRWLCPRIYASQY